MRQSEVKFPFHEFSFQVLTPINCSLEWETIDDKIHYIQREKSSVLLIVLLQKLTSSHTCRGEKISVCLSLFCFSQQDSLLFTFRRMGTKDKPIVESLIHLIE